MIQAASKQWLLAYNQISHGLVLSLVALGVITLLVIAAKDQDPTDQRTQPLPFRILRWIRRHPVVTVVFAGYTVAMVQGTSWFYPELPDLYQGFIHSPLLDQRQVQERIIAETMQRNRVRHLPLAHQDLHALSWFTPYVKVWMLVSAVELMAIVVLSARMVQEMVGPPRVPGLLLSMALLFLFAPATGWGFFQLVYCERLLTVLFAGYAFSYWRFIKSGRRRSGAFTLMWALLGVYVKDIAVLLFVIPALLRWLTTPAARRWRSLESALIALVPVVAVSYVTLSLLPSLVAQATPFSSEGRWSLDADWRLIALFGFNALRLLPLVRNRRSTDLLDGLNLAVILYAVALWASVGYPYASFWTLPVQLVTVLDLGWIWCCWLVPRLGRRPASATVAALGMAGSLVLVGLEHRASETFSKRVRTIKTTQRRWRETFEAMAALSRDSREKGEPVNVIFMRSYFNQHTLKPLAVDRLIEYHRQRRTYTVVEGLNRGEAYTPQPGDFLLTIDKRERKDLGQDGQAFAEIYRHSTAKRAGRIFRHR